jgi:hypothetical protein
MLRDETVVQVLECGLLLNPAPPSVCVICCGCRANIIPIEADEPHIQAGRKVTKALRTIAETLPGTSIWVHD